MLVQASIAKDVPSPQDLALKGSSGGKATASGHWVPDDADFKFVHWPETHEAPASWHRDELAFALSCDEGKTWTDPAVIARKPKGNICYPSIFEIEPGKLWVAAAGSLHIELNESDFISKSP